MKSSAKLVLSALTLAVVAPGLARAQAQSTAADHMTYAREADELRLGANGMEKCRAFKKVSQHTDQLQATDHGTLTPADTKRLMAELAAAKAMAPKSLTAIKCGVPL